MQEANKSKYLVDGLLIKHFKIFPYGFDKNNLFEEQKIFLVYLLGSIPSIEEWSMQFDYMTKKEKIIKMTEKDIKLTPEDIDMAKLHDKNIDDLKIEQLKIEKDTKLKELNEKFGIEKEESKTEKSIKINEDIKENKNKTLWEMLSGKNLIDGKKEE